MLTAPFLYCFLCFVPFVLLGSIVLTAPFLYCFLCFVPCVLLGSIVLTAPFLYCFLCFVPFVLLGSIVLTAPFLYCFLCFVPYVLLGSIVLTAPFLYCFLCFTSPVSFTSSYTEDEPFLRAFSQLFKLQFTAMVTYSFHLYSRSSHHFILSLQKVKIDRNHCFPTTPMFGLK